MFTIPLCVSCSLALCVCMRWHYNSSMKDGEKSRRKQRLPNHYAQRTQSLFYNVFFLFSGCFIPFFASRLPRNATPCQTNRTTFQTFSSLLLLNRYREFMVTFFVVLTLVRCVYAAVAVVVTVTILNKKKKPTHKNVGIILSFRYTLRTFNFRNALLKT